MTTSEAQPSAPTSLSGRQIWRSARGPVLFAFALLLIAVVSVLAQGGLPAGYLKPDAVNDAGSRALATLLQQRGVDIEPVSTVDEAARATENGELLLLAGSQALSTKQLGRLARLPGDRLLIEPTDADLNAFAPEVNRLSKNVPVRPRGGGCDLRAVRLAGAATTGGQAYAADVAPVQGCYPASGSPTLLRYDKHGRTITVIGTGVPFTNAALDTQGNAALTMNLIGTTGSVVWLVPDPLAVGDDGGSGSPLALLPPAVPIAAVQLAIAVVLVALWRARRLGPVVSEPLPVIVRAAETVEGRSRLYRSRRARDRAATALREGCRSRVAGRLGLGRDPDPRALTAAVSGRIGGSAEDVGAVLYGSVPTDDAALVRLADDLDTLEREVRRS